LASSQNTSVDMLIVDMLYRQAAAPATESAPPAQEVVSVPLASEPPVEPVIDDTALEDAFAAIARMSESLGKLEQTLTDVDLPAAPQESVEGAQQEQGANADQLPALLNGLADRLENILSGAQAQRRTRPSKRTSPRLETEPLLFSDHEM